MSDEIEEMPRPKPESGPQRGDRKLDDANALQIWNGDEWKQASKGKKGPKHVQDQ